MPGIAAFLAGSGPERRRDVINVVLHDVEPSATTRRSEVSDRALEQMPCVVELVVVAQVGPTLVRLAAVVPAVEIAVRTLRFGEILYDGVDLCFDRLVAPVRKRVARRLDPLADVRVPEHLDGEPML